MPRRWASAALTASRVVMPGRISAAMSRTASRELARVQDARHREAPADAFPGMFVARRRIDGCAGGRGQEGFGQEAGGRQARLDEPGAGLAHHGRIAAGVDHAAGPVVAAGQRQVLDARRRGCAGSRPRAAAVQLDGVFPRRVGQRGMPAQARMLALQRIQQWRGVAVVRRAAAPVQRHRCHAPVVQRRHQDGEHARESRAGGQQHQMVRAVV